MCGIAGQVSFELNPSQQLVADLVKGINHRGPDKTGIWTSENGNCIFGHARLSIIDLSPLGNQPMYDSLTGNCIVFNGEIYNFKELKIECEFKGEKFVSQSDTEVILVLYRLYGIDCLEKLRGMFAFAIWDNNKKSIFIARDRVGKKPLNYALTKNGLIFCSEIDPLSKHPEISREKDNEALELYLQLQAVPSPWTIYKHIRKLKPAHYAIFNQSGFYSKQYWNVDYSNKIKISEKNALETFEEKLTEAVRLRMISDVPIGALLSGGVDSSLVVALMSKLHGDKINTYSIGFQNEKFNELPFAQEVANQFNTNHNPEVINGNVNNLLPTLIKNYGEPFADSSAVPSFMVANYARKHVKVVMNGDGGDELLGGYSRYALSSFQMNISPKISNLISDETAIKFGIALQGERRSNVVKFTRKLLQEYLRPELISFAMFDNFFNDRIRPSLFKDNNNNLVKEWRKEWFKMASKYSNHPIDKMLWYDNRTYLADDLLVKMDIASMHCGLETRSPLLDHKVIEFCASLPVSYKNQNGVTKYLLKKLAEKYFPKDFIYRKKMGFGIPMAEWMRGPLKELVQDILFSPNLMAPLNLELIKQIYNKFNQGEDAYKDRVWVLFMYGMWQQHYNNFNKN